MYMQGDIPTIVNEGGANANNGWGEGWWIIIIFALLFGYGRGGFGNGNGSETIGYELGKVATTNDIASGFNNSAVLGGLNDLRLGQAGIQQTLCQGFGGVNTSILSTANAIERQIADCCCSTQRSIDAVNYNMAKNTCDIIDAGHADTQRIIDFLTGEKISSLQHENALLTSQLSQNSQTKTLLEAINRTPYPAYIVPNPYSSYGYGYGFPTSVVAQ